MVLLSHQNVGKVYICYLSLCSIFLSHNVSFVAPGLVMPLFHFQFLLLLLIIIIIIIIITAMEFSPGGSILHIST